LNILEFAAAVWVVSLVAGFLGSLTGIGGEIVLTPVLTLVAFAIQRDRLYVVVTVIVLAILLYSLTSGYV
jgi:uncharacterized membrane protein